MMRKAPIRSRLAEDKTKKGVSNDPTAPDKSVRPKGYDLKCYEGDEVDTQLGKACAAEH
jgi:hypothetical protein